MVALDDVKATCLQQGIMAKNMCVIEKVRMFISWGDPFITIWILLNVWLFD